MLVENLQLHHLSIWHHLGYETLCLFFGISMDAGLLYSAVIASREKNHLLIKRIEQPGSVL